MDYSFGNWVKRRRKALDLTQQGLAQEIGCSPSLIFKIESDERRPSRQIAELLAERLEISSEQREQFLKVARQEKSVDHLETIQPVSDTPPEPVPHIPLPNLPLPLTPLIGREHELRAITQKIQDPTCRLFTLIGPGGVGKTSLALEVAHHLREVSSGYAVYYVSLVGTSASEFIIPAIADALGFAFSGNYALKTQLFHFLREKRILLVLDNLEHLLDGIELLDELLEHAPYIKLLTTSRERLNLRTEWVFEVQGLPIPAQIEMDYLGENSAAFLFVQRAKQVDVQFIPGSQDLPAITRICQLVDGLPLGLELAATWVRLLSPHEIVSEIERSMDFLTTTARGVPQRHRSIRAVFDHSWDLLSDEERLVIQRLSVFRGGFTREAAEQVAGATLTLLLALMEKSLVRLSPSSRYDLHELVRQYALTHLQADTHAAQATHARHADYFLNLLKVNEYTLRSDCQKSTFDLLKPEIDNIRLAWDFAVKSAQLDSLRVAAGALYYFYELQQFFHEAKDLFDRAAKKIQACLDAGGMELDQARLLGALADMQTRQAFFHQRLGQNREAVELYRTNLVRLDKLNEPYTTAYTYTYLGIVTQVMGEIEIAKTSLVKGLLLARPLAHPWLAEVALCFLGAVEHADGCYEDAYAHFVEAIALCKVMKDPYITLLTGALFSRTAQRLGRFTMVQELLVESLRIARESNNLWAIGLGLEQTAAIAQATGQQAEARRLLGESAAMHREVGDLWSLARVLDALSQLEFDLNDLEQADQDAKEAIKAAVEGQFYANGLEALATLAGIRARQGDNLIALEFALVVLGQPASTWDARDRAEKVRIQIGNSIAPHEIAAAQSCVNSWSLESINQALAS